MQEIYGGVQDFSERERVRYEEQENSRNSEYHDADNYNDETSFFSFAETEEGFQA
jgi:hypothetical protein